MANNKRSGGYGFGINLTGPGTVFTFAFIALAVGMGILLSRGVSPKNVGTPQDEEPAPVELVIEPTVPGQKGLQLRTLKFKECATISAVSLQLDITGSMQPFMGDLKNAVMKFVEPLSDESVIGIQVYSTINPRVELVPISYYRDVKDEVRSKVSGLIPDGRTPSYDAIIYSGELLREALPKFPDKKFSYIFFSDGNPNEGPDTPEDIASAAQIIKDMGVTVYAIGLGDVRPEIIRAVASSPDKAVVTNNSKDLENLYKLIAEKICTSATPPTPTQ